MGNCVGFYNYKFFLCFLIWSIVLCSFLLVQGLPVLVWVCYGNMSPSAFCVLFVSFVSLTLVVAAAGMLVTHVELVFSNATTIEHPQTTLFCVQLVPSDPNNEGAKKSRYDLGVSRNLQQVFGNRWWLWLLPVFSSLGDGYAYPENTADKEP